MAGGITTSFPTPLKSSSSPCFENGLFHLKFGTYSPNSQISDVNFSKDCKILSESVPQSTDLIIKATNVQQTSASDSFLAQKYQDQRSEKVNLKEGLPVVSFDIGVKEQLISKVHFVIVAKFSHGRPLFRDFQSFLSSFKFRGQFVISAFDRKHVFIDFDVFDDFVKLWMTKSCVVKGFKVRFFRWTDSFSPSTEISIAPVWVSLPGLPLYFLEEEALLSIATVLGKPLYIDPLNLTRQKVGAACICIALDVSKTLPEAIWIHFMSEGKVLEQILQRVVYHDLPPFCKGCYHLGHDVEGCKLRIGSRLNGDSEKDTHEEHVTLDKQIPEVLLSKGRLSPTRDNHPEEGEIEEVTGNEGRHMNEAIHNSVTSDSRIEGKPVTDTEHKGGSSQINGDVNHHPVADVNPFAPLEGIKNDVDFSTDLDQTSADSAEPLNQITLNRNVEETAGHSAPSGFVATVDKNCAYSTSETDGKEQRHDYSEVANSLATGDAGTSQSVSAVTKDQFPVTDVNIVTVSTNEIFTTKWDKELVAPALSNPVDDSQRIITKTADVEDIEEGEICTKSGKDIKGNLKSPSATSQVNETEFPQNALGEDAVQNNKDGDCSENGYDTLEKEQNHTGAEMEEGEFIPEIQPQATIASSDLTSDAAIQRYIHSCEAVQIGRDMIEDNKRDTYHKESGVDIDASAIQYTKKKIAAKVSQEWSERMKQIGTNTVLPPPIDLEDQSTPVSKAGSTKAESSKTATESQDLQAIIQYMAKIRSMYDRNNGTQGLISQRPDIEPWIQRIIPKLNLPHQLAKENNFRFIIDKHTETMTPEQFNEDLADHLADLISPLIFPSQEQEFLKSTIDARTDLEEKEVEMGFSDSVEDIVAPKRRGRPPKQKEQLPTANPPHVPRKKGRPRKFT